MADVWFESADGLRLYARDSGPSGPLTPLLCLSGLTRNSKDFEPLFARLSPRRRIVAPDYRGRGRSQYAADGSAYRPDVELDDAMRLLDRLGLARVGIIGTSRGGLVAMLMGCKHRDRLAGVLFNDIGPELEIAGLIRIRDYLGGPVELESWDDAIAALKRTSAGFETLNDAQWLRLARAVFRDEDGRPAMDYDPHLGDGLPSAQEIAEGKVPALWDLFEGLAGLPLTVLRGANSDLLSTRVVEEMAMRHPGLDAVTVDNRGHVPFLDEPEAEAAIDRWLTRIDR